MQVANVRVGQESAGIRPRRLVRGGHPDRLIPLLEVVSGADQLPIERLIEAALDPANIREDVLARLDLRHRDGAPAGRGLGRNTIASKGGTGGSRHHEESSPGHLLPPCDSRTLNSTSPAGRLSWPWRRRCPPEVCPSTGRGIEFANLEFQEPGKYVGAPKRLKAPGQGSWQAIDPLWIGARQPYRPRPPPRPPPLAAWKRAPPDRPARPGVGCRLRER